MSGEPNRAGAFRRPQGPAREARARFARRASIPSRTVSANARTSPRSAPPTRAWRRGSRPTPATASPVASSAAAVTARRPSSTSATAAGRSSSTPARTCSAPEAYALLVHLDIGDIVGVEGTAMATRRGGELSLAIDHWQLLSKSLRPPPERAPRARGRRDPLPAPRARPDRERGEPPALRRPRPHDHRDPPLARRPRLRRGRDPGPAAALRRRPGAALHHPPQPARPRPLPADRDRALPEAAGGRRHRPGLRARQGLPQRGRLAQAQPRVHDARVVRGLRRLREDRPRPRAAGLRGRRAGARARRWSSATGSRSTSRRRGAG